MKDEYIRYLMARELYNPSFDVEIKDSWFTPDEFAALRDSIPRRTFAAFGLEPGDRYQSNVAEIFSILDGAGAIKRSGDDYVGHFIRIEQQAKDGVLREMMQSSPVDANVRSLGPETLRTAARRIAEEDGFGSDVSDQDDSSLDESGPKVPASDRVVTLNHNQIVEVDDGVGELLTVVDSERDQPNNPDDTSLALGKIKAGREMVRAAILDLDLFRMSMIAGLTFLIEKYRDHAIGAAAGNLLSVILKHFGML